MGTSTLDIQQALIERCRMGDSSSQQEVYRRYARNMFNVAHRVLKHRAEAEDVLQESFLYAFTRIHEYRGDSSFGAWLKRIVLNKSISELRKRRTEWLDEQTVDLVEPVEDHDEEEQQYMLQHVKDGIAALPDGYRVVLSLYLLEGYDHAEIAEILRISESTSKSQFLRAKAKLKEYLHHKKMES